MLDELDRQLVRAQRSLALADQPSGIWDIEEIRPSFGDLGTIPEDLVPRALGILTEYESVFVKINAARRVVGDHLDVLQSIRGEQLAPPVYFDRVG
jgi:hypothetical protein